MIRARLRRLGLPALGAALLMGGCALPSDPPGEGAVVRGTWTLTGTQSAPSATLDGQLTVSAQDGDQISGSAGWQERDAAGMLRPDGGPMSGRVIGETDVDFDITVGGIARRHVGRIRADTIEGSWVQVSDGRSGTFRLVRGTP